MKKRAVILSAFLLLALLGTIAWEALNLPPDPIYQGVRLSSWLRQYAGTNVFQPDARVPAQNADEAVRAIGTNALPLLLQMFRAEDSSLKLRLARIALRQKFIKVPYVPAYALNFEASQAFKVLGSSASNAVPALVESYRQRSESSPAGILAVGFLATALGNIGPPASNAVPILMLDLGSTNKLVWDTSIRSLGQIHAQPGLVVPELMKQLEAHRQNYWEGQMAAVALGQYGSNAQAALPLLSDFLKSAPDNVEKKSLVEAIENIDPGASAQAGNK